MSEPLTADDLRAIRERMEKATKWTYLGETLIMLGDTYENSDEDWAFVAYARQDVARLLDEVERLQKAEAAMVEADRLQDLDAARIGAPTPTRDGDVTQQEGTPLASSPSPLVTDAMVEAAAKAAWDWNDTDRWEPRQRSWADAKEWEREVYHRFARSALTAAIAVQPGPMTSDDADVIALEKAIPIVTNLYEILIRAVDEAAPFSRADVEKESQQFIALLRRVARRLAPQPRPVNYETSTKTAEQFAADGQQIEQVLRERDQAADNFDMMARTWNETQDECNRLTAEVTALRARAEATDAENAELKQSIASLQADTRRLAMETKK